MGTQIPSNDQKGSKKGPDKDDLLQYFSTHIRETVAYVLLILGIILLFFQPIYGGLLVGLVAGVYFGDYFVSYIKALKNDFDRASSVSELTKHLILLGIALAVFIAAPGLFIGAAVAVIIKLLFVG